MIGGAAIAWFLVFLCLSAGEGWFVPIWIIICILFVLFLQHFAVPYLMDKINDWWENRKQKNNNKE
jgi:fatty acid desaturase